MPDQAKSVRRACRGFMRVGLRGLIVVVLVIGVWLGWLVRSARIQREAVVAIRQAGGTAKYDWEWSNGNETPEGKPRAPGWLVDLVGGDYFGHVVDVDLYDNDVTTDATVEQIGRFTRLWRLMLIKSSVNDASLVHLKRLTDLHSLELCGTRITDAGLSNLTGLRNLTQLILPLNQVSDAGLAHLKGLTDLTELNLWRTQVSDAGMVHLRGLTNLVSLELGHTRVNDAGLVDLKGLTKLSYLGLGGTRVTAAGVNDLKQALPSLTIDY
jgi:internalin A